jgi:alanyl-tRNA synthetase
MQHGFHAVKLFVYFATDVGGGGGGRPNLATAGAKDVEKLDSVLSNFSDSVKAKLN